MGTSLVVQWLRIHLPMQGRSHMPWSNQATRESLHAATKTFLAALGLRYCRRAFSICGKQGLLFIAVRRLLIAVASFVAEHRL